MAEDVVVPIRELSDEEALASLRERGKTTMAAAALGRQWGWNERRAQRKLDDWETDKLIRRRGKQITVLGTALIRKPDMSLLTKTDTKSDSKSDMSVLVKTNSKPDSKSDGATPLARLPIAAGPPALWSTPRGTALPPPPHERTPGQRWRAISWPLVIIAYGFFGLGIGINVWNASSSGPLTDVALPATMGVLAEAVMFFLPAWTMTLPIGRRMLALVLLMFVSAFALTNSLRMASIIAADQATARADRQTEGVQTADRALEAARARRDEACGRGLGKTVACQARQAEVAKLEGKQTQATAKVVAQARPESGDVAKLVAWISKGAIQPGADDFAMLCLLFRTFLPQVGGIVLMLAQRGAA